MKETDLMIGDWVLYNPNVFIEDEYELPKDCYPTKISCGEDINLAIEDCYSPIPLIAEILEKNGFEKCKIPEIEYIGWRLNEEFSVELNAVDDFDWNDVHIAYVHQLQHALRLCNIEKEIEI